MWKLRIFNILLISVGWKKYSNTWEKNHLWNFFLPKQNIQRLYKKEACQKRTQSVVKLRYGGYSEY